MELRLSLNQWLFAAFYDLLNSSVEDRLSEYRQETAGRAKGDVLEIGGGTGANLPFYSNDLKLTVLEPNPHMSKRLRERAKKLEFDVTVVREKGEKIPFPDKSFDSVVTTLVLCMVDDMSQVISEARRVLKPGGVFYFYEHVASEGTLRRKFENILNPAWCLLTTGCNLNREISSAIKNGGFEHVEIREFDLSVGILVTIPNIVGIAKI